MTIGELVEALDSLGDEVKSLTFPIDFKDPSLEEMEIVDTYNTYLSNGDYATALEYRTSHPELESFIFDANKMNLLQTFVLTVQSALGTKYDNSMSGSEATNVQEALDECFQSVSDGKALVASAITDKKVPTDATATFEEMANNISSIVLGSGTAIASDVLEGKTFTNDDGVEYTGTMHNMGAVTKSLNCGGSYTIPAGYHNGSGKITANSLASQTSATATAAQIASGKTAWVNGTKITGTATIAATYLTGTVTGTLPMNNSVSVTINFSPAFSAKPSSFQYACVYTSGVSNGANVYADYTVTSLTASAAVLTINHKSGTTPTYRLTWTAQA